MTPASSRDVITLGVSIVVTLTDPLRPEGRPIGPLRVRLDGRPEVPVVNLSGRYVFCDLPKAAAAYRVVCRPDYYLPEIVPAPPAPALSETDDPGAFPRTETRVEIALRPAVSYPFPPALSLVRGIVRSPGDPLAGAVLQLSVSAPAQAWIDPLWTTYATGAGGGFAFAFRFKRPGAAPALPVTVQASHALGTRSTTVGVRRNGVQRAAIVYP